MCILTSNVHSAVRDRAMQLIKTTGDAADDNATVSRHASVKSALLATIRMPERASKRGVRLAPMKPHRAAHDLNTAIVEASTVG